MPEEKNKNNKKHSSSGSSNGSTLGGGSFIIKHTKPKDIRKKSEKSNKKHVEVIEIKDEKHASFKVKNKDEFIENPIEEIEEGSNRNTEETSKEDISVESPFEGEVVDTFSKRDISEQKQKKDKEKQETEEEIPPEETEEGTLDKIKDFFNSIGIDSRTIISGCIFLVLIIVFIYGLYYAYTRFVSTPSEEPVSEEIQETEFTERERVERGTRTGLTPSFIIGREGIKSRSETIPQVGVSYVIGQNEILFNTLVTAPIESAFQLGLEGRELERDLARWLRILDELKNAYETDILALMDRSNNRAKVLDEYSLDLNRINTEAQNALDEINENLDILNVNLNTANTRQNNLETDFFTSVENLAGENAEMILQDFISISKLESEIIARKGALERVRLIYIGFLEDFQKRILLIEANREALIKNVRVFDVEDSTLELIFPPDTLQEQ